MSLNNYRVFTTTKSWQLLNLYNYWVLTTTKSLQLLSLNNYWVFMTTKTLQLLRFLDQIFIMSLKTDFLTIVTAIYYNRHLLRRLSCDSYLLQRSGYLLWRLSTMAVTYCNGHPLQHFFYIFYKVFDIYDTFPYHRRSQTLLERGGYTRILRKYYKSYI